MIPKRIFQTWKTKNADAGLMSLMKTWKTKNPNYEYQLYDDDDCLNFLRGFDKKVYESYQKIIPGAFKADLWRYCALFEFGGFYCDVDTVCIGSIDTIPKDIDFAAPIDLNCGPLKHNLFNAFIGAAKGSRIMEGCIRRIVSNVDNRRHDIHPLDFSACGVLGRSVNEFMSMEETTSFVGREGRAGSVYFLKFHHEGEIVGCVGGGQIFQNKNGNSKIKEIYDLAGGSSWASHPIWTVDSKLFL